MKTSSTQLTQLCKIKLSYFTESAIISNIITFMSTKKKTCQLNHDRALIVLHNPISEIFKVQKKSILEVMNYGTKRHT